jgi:hypothetical protein
MPQLGPGTLPPSVGLSGKPGRRAMSAMEIRAAGGRPSAEIDWRHVWLTTVMIDSGDFGPPKIARHEMQIRKNTLTRRLRKLRRLRAVLDQP